MDSVAIRPAVPADLPSVGALLEEAAMLTTGVADHFADFLVAVDGGAVVGSAGLEFYGDGALLRSVAVTPARRREGLGARLVGEALAAARERGARTVALLTENAGPFFRRLGFRESARERLDPRLLTSSQFSELSCASALVMTMDLGHASKEGGT